MSRVEKMSPSLPRMTSSAAPQFTDAQLKGNWAEQHVAALLSSAGCLVRHVHQGHDSGIDLYCEKITQGTPHLHFWVQVKALAIFKTPDGRRKFRPRKYYY